MYYSAELEYLCKVLRKMHIQIMRLDSGNLQLEQIDFGLRKFLGREEMYDQVFRDIFANAKENTIYKLTDELMCKYIFLLLPDNQGTVPLVAGPYMSFEMTHEQLLEEAERLGVPAWRVPRMQECYYNVPILSDETTLLVLMGSFGEVLWGSGKAFEIIDVNREMHDVVVPIASLSDDVTPESTMMRMKMMETRYDYENV